MDRLTELEQRIARLEQAMFPLKRPYMPTTPPGWNPTFQCPVCNMKWEGAMGYVCPRSDCPSIARSTS